MTTRSCTPDLGVEMLCLSTLMGCFIGKGCKKNKLGNKKIKFVMDMCKEVQSKDCRNQNILRCFLYLSNL